MNRESPRFANGDMRSTHLPRANNLSHQQILQSHCDQRQKANYQLLRTVVAMPILILCRAYE